MMSIVLSASLLMVLMAAWGFGGRLPWRRGQEGTVPADRLAVHVQTLAERLAPRDAYHAENLDRVAAYIREELERAKGTVSEQPFEVGGTTYRNVIAHFGPETEERIVVGAHYDAAGPLPGADDNASGVAGLIELGRLLGASPPKLRVELVAFALEEPPHFGSSSMGSAVHAGSLKRRGVPVRAMICLEMIGYFSDEPESQRFPLPGLRWIYPSRGNFIAVVGRPGEGGLAGRVKKAMQRATPLPVHSATLPSSVPGVGLSDHRNYWDAGYNAVMITDTAFFRNDNYHTEEDTPETLDYRRMAQVVQGVHAAVLGEAARRGARRK
ncbi:MAG TPA: M28 family peptidase [Thermoanaerobaculia bacterium]|nr:M28 family peptidase [Thermoanaerobaculia bacterium]